VRLTFYCTDFVSRRRTHVTDVSSTNVSHKWSVHCVLHCKINWATLT